MRAPAMRAGSSRDVCKGHIFRRLGQKRNGMLNELLKAFPPVPSQLFTNQELILVFSRSDRASFRTPSGACVWESGSVAGTPADPIAGNTSSSFSTNLSDNQKSRKEVTTPAAMHPITHPTKSERMFFMSEKENDFMRVLMLKLH